VANYGDWQFATYLGGLQGVRPELPMSWADLERRAEQVLSPELWSYVAGGAGDERTQRVNVEAFDWWGLMPRMLVGAAQRDLSVQLFGRRLPTPLLMAPVGVTPRRTPTATATWSPPAPPRRPACRWSPRR
jgi:lactate 2-monooxygenase